MRRSRLEIELRKQGTNWICGVDEAGRGPLAGPVVAAAVILPADFDARGIADSKKLSEPRREACFERITRDCVGFGVGRCDPVLIDEINILQATFQAMRQALGQLTQTPEIVLVDGNQRIPNLSIPQQTIVRGDGSVAAIACASIIAKVSRDRIMREYHRLHPEYGFDQHKGYPTAQHRANIARFGVLPIHRKSFNLLDPQFELAFSISDDGGH